MFNMQQIGVNICRFRKAIGITQVELADRLGISFQAISNWEQAFHLAKDTIKPRLLLLDR